MIPEAWLQLLEPVEPRPASKLQRQTLYKMNYPRPLVKALTTDEADRLIKVGITVRQRGPV